MDLICLTVCLMNLHIKYRPYYAPPNKQAVCCSFWKGFILSFRRKCENTPNQDGRSSLYVWPWQTASRNRPRAIFMSSNLVIKYEFCLREILEFTQKFSNILMQHKDKQQDISINLDAIRNVYILWSDKVRFHFVTSESLKMNWAIYRYDKSKHNKSSD